MYVNATNNAKGLRIIQSKGNKVVITANFGNNEIQKTILDRQKLLTTMVRLKKGDFKDNKQGNLKRIQRAENELYLYFKPVKNGKSDLITCDMLEFIIALMQTMGNGADTQKYFF